MKNYRNMQKWNEKRAINPSHANFYTNSPQTKHWETFGLLMCLEGTERDSGRNGAAATDKAD